jgi:hypothetical protein
MRRTGRIALAVVLLATIVNVADLALPLRALACSCMATGPEDIGTFADEPGIVVFVGTVLSVSNIGDGMGHTAGEIAIQRVFKGDLAARMRIIGGGGGDCTIGLEPGQRMITAASLDRRGITPGLCMPYGDPANAEGQKLIAVATAAYGPGFVPLGGPTTPTDPPAAPAGGAADLVLPLALMAAVSVALALFGLVTLLTRRRRPVE